jgi:hypothetical protein
MKITNFKNKSLKSFLKLGHAFNLPALLMMMEHEPPTKRILFWKLPTDFSKMTLQQRFDLQFAFEDGDIFFTTFKTLTKIPKFVLKLIKVKKLFPFVLVVSKELERRNNRMSDLRIEYTAEEKAAGIEQVNHGIFGIIDNIVKISGGAYTHEQVPKLSDNMVFGMLKIEADNSKFQRRLQNIIHEKQKRKYK